MTPARRRRRRRLLTGVLAILAALVALRLVAPWVLKFLIASRLGAALAVPVQIDDVDLELWAGAVTVRGIAAAPAPEVSASTVRVDALAVRWSWDDLLAGVVAVDVDVSGLDATIDLQRPWPARPARTGGSVTWLRSLNVVDGAARLLLAAGVPPILTLTELQASLVEPLTAMRTEAMTTQFSLTARAGEAGRLTIGGSIAPVAPAATWTLHFVLERLDLRALNPLFQAVFEMDVEHGWLSVTGELTVGLGRLRGRLQPRFDELQLLGRGEQRVRHPMAEALFSEMLSGADLPIDIDQPTATPGESPMVAEIGRINAQETLTRIILRGFIRRLGTIDGYEADAKRAEVDFPAGRLSFYDVTLTRSGGEVGRPFVHVARLDIVVEQSAVDREVPTYKMISLHQPTLIFVTGATDAKSQLTIDPDWQEKVSVLPYPTDRLEVFGGRLEYRDDTTEPPTSFFVSNLEVRADKLGRAKVGTKRRVGTLVGRARVMDLSPLAIDAEFSPGVVPLDLAVRIHLDPLPLDQLNELLRGRLGVDISAGTLGLTVDLDAHEDHLQGTVTPALRGVRVLGKRELEVDHPLRELMLERRMRRLDGVALKLDYRVRKNLLRELPGALLSAALHAE